MGALVVVFLVAFMVAYLLEWLHFGVHFAKIIRQVNHEKSTREPA